MDEIARGGATTVRRALRGFDGDADADGAGGTSRDEVDGAFKGVMPSPLWDRRVRAQPERAGTDLE